MGGERAQERTTEGADHDVAPDPPAAAAGGAAAAPAPGAGAAAALDPEVLTAAVDANNGAKALRLAAAAPREAITALTAATKLEAFYTLMRATPLTAITRTQLNTLYHGVDLANKFRVFEVRFRITITGTGATTFTEAELNAMYDQAAVLPPAHVEGLSTFTQLRRVATGPATHSGTTVVMNQMPDATRYAGTFRHEIGHAIDAALGAVCTQLRTTQAGWTRYANIEAMITAAGGYGNLPPALQPVVRTALDNYRGPGRTFNSPTPTFEATLQAAVMAAHPDVVQSTADGSDAVTTDMNTLRGLYGSNLLLRIGNMSQGTNNYWRFRNWPGDGAKHFFINHWYSAAFSVASTTFQDMVAWGNVKAAFSDKEWFAEVYAEWYRGGTHRTFPQFVTDFMNTHVVRFGSPATAPAAGATGGGGNPRVP